MVENVGIGLGPQTGAEWATLQREEVVENTCLFHTVYAHQTAEGGG